MCERETGWGTTTDSKINGEFKMKCVKQGRGKCNSIFYFCFLSTQSYIKHIELLMLRELISLIYFHKRLKNSSRCKTRCRKTH